MARSLRTPRALAASLLAIGCLVAASSLVPGINRERAELQLTFTEDVTENLPPELALTQAGLASFRGIAIDLLWLRAYQMERQGQYWDAQQLADWITQLQPRSAKVWAFRAWNMTYNLSVATHTPEERWMWVRAGIDMLRDRGLRVNPNSANLCRELSWMILHKLGQDADDMHWYYKAELAAEWQKLLGEPPIGGGKSYVRWFRPVASAYDELVSRSAPGEELLTVAEAALQMTIAEAIGHRAPPTIFEIDGALAKALDEALAARNADRVASLRSALRLVVSRRAWLQTDPWVRLFKVEPETRTTIDQLRELGWTADRTLLAELAHRRARDITEPDDLDRWLAEHGGSPGFQQLLAFLRAYELERSYNMDAGWMLVLTEGEWLIGEEGVAELERKGREVAIPLDWRHPGAHSLYWAALGVRRAAQLEGQKEFDLITSDRLTLLSLQNLTHGGRVLFDLRDRSYRQLADPRFIDCYDQAIFGTGTRMVEAGGEDELPPGFAIGHENFLSWSVQSLFFHGEVELAEEYLSRLRTLYSDRQGGARYSQTVRDFVVGEFVQWGGIRTPEDARTAISGSLFQSFLYGLAADNPAAARQYLDVAKEIHRRYQARMDADSPEAEQVGRSLYGLPAFEDMASDAFLLFLTYPDSRRVDPLSKTRAWSNAPLSLKERVYLRGGHRLRTHAEELGLDPDRAFPAPE